MIRRLFIALYYCRPQRSYAACSFLVTVILLFLRRRRWLFWKPLQPDQLEPSWVAISLGSASVVGDLRRLVPWRQVEDAWRSGSDLAVRVLRDS